MKNVLVPLNGGDNRGVLKDLLSFLSGMAGDLNVILLGTFLVPVSPSEQVISAHDEARRKSRQKLEEEMRFIGGLSKDKRIRFEIESQMGNAANVISRLIAEKGIDCVVLTDAKLQEDIVKLLNRIHCPVIVLPTQSTNVGSSDSE